MSEPIRVLHIVTTMNRGGLETMLMNYYRNIDKSKIQFDFLLHRSEKSDYEDEIKDLGGTIFRIQPLNPFSRSYREELDEFFKSHHYDIVHCHQDCLSSIALGIAKNNNVKIRIAHSHNANQDHNLKYIIKLYYKNKIYEEATHLLACGKEAGDWMYNGKKYIIMNNAIETNKFIYDEELRNKNRKMMNLNDKFVIGHIGRFNKQKNHEFIIDIFNELHKLNSNSRLVLVGTGELEEKIKEKVNRYSLNDFVIFYGLCDKVHEILQSFDVFLFPSLYEGLPVTMVEAQASGLKCFISNKVPDQCILSDNVEILSLNDDPKRWANEINKYSLGYERKNTLRDIENHNFDIKENAKWLEEFYLNECNK